MITLLLRLCLNADAAPINLGAVRAVRFMIINALTGAPLPDACLLITDPEGLRQSRLLVASTPDGTTPSFNLSRWSLAVGGEKAPLITLIAGTETTMEAKPIPTAPEIKLVVVASLITSRPLSAGSQATTRSSTFINKFTDTNQQNLRSITRTIAGVASDSTGQVHIRGEHSDITYMVDGVPLPETLSGSMSQMVVPGTIKRLSVIVGGFAPKYGGQTAGVFDITTKAIAKVPEAHVNLEGGTYDTTNGGLQFSGPLSKRASLFLSYTATRSINVTQPPQPNDQTAHNTGASLDAFGKIAYRLGKSDRIDLTMNTAPDTMQIANRTSLSSYYASVGQGYGFLGLEDPSSGLLTQQQEGMDITQRETTDYGVLNWHHRFNLNNHLEIAVTLMRSFQRLQNHNPLVNVLDLQPDNSIEYNPTAVRSSHNTQISGNYVTRKGPHDVQIGFLDDIQSGHESYQIIPASQLALDDLAALDPLLVPSGSVARGTNGQPELDKLGNPVYVPNSAVVPTLLVDRSGFYRAFYVQDTYHFTHRFITNYGLRFDWYKQAQNLGQPIVDTSALSPRFNFSYDLGSGNLLRWSYDRIFNIPPLAQGALVGEAIQPERLNQYDISIQHQISAGQSVKLAYYYKDITDQIDVGLLVPGSEIGLFSAVNFTQGAVHGIEFTYDLAPPHPNGMNAYFTYTYSTAKPNGVDNTGAPAPNYNDHDQRNTIGMGLAYTTKRGLTASIDVTYNSGLASSVVFPNGPRIARTITNFQLNSGSNLFGHDRGGLSLNIDNVFDDRSVINFQSGFSGTRFQQGRRILLAADLKF